jgi:hypothetical protein
MFASVVTQTFSYFSSDLLRLGPYMYLNKVNSIIRYTANLAQNRNISCFLSFHIISKVCICLPTLSQLLEVFILYYLFLLLKLSILLFILSSVNTILDVYKSFFEITSESGLTTEKGILYKL